MKRMISMITAALMVVGTSTTAFAAELNVTVDGRYVAWTDAKPFIDENDRTLVPLRPIGNALGLEVDWNDDTNTASFTDGETTAEFVVGSDQYHAFLNDTDFHVYVEMDTTPVIKDSRIYAPARYLAECFHYVVGWHQSTQTVLITKVTEPEEEIIVTPQVPAGEVAAISPVTAEAGSNGTTYITFNGVSLAEEPDIFEYSIDSETTLNGLGFNYTFIPEENYVEMNLGADLTAPVGTYPVTFAIPAGFFADAQEDVVVSTTFTVTEPKAETVMAKILENLDFGLWLAEGSDTSAVTAAVQEETGWVMDGSPFALTVSNGAFVTNDEGALDAFSCTLTVTNTETNETFSVSDAVTSLYFISADE